MTERLAPLVTAS
jgi:hypothetical protein